MKVIFDTRPNSGYDDGATRYHFPVRNYLPIAAAAVGDWVLYREPRRDGGRSAYVGIARLASIDPDPASLTHRYARLTDYLPFDTPVPLEGPFGYWEKLLRAVPDRRAIGVTLQGKSVRPVGEEDFAAIVLAGLGELPTVEEPAQAEVIAPAETDHPDHPDLPVRRIQQFLATRKIRDAMFRRRICKAYDDRCAVTGIRVLDGRGRSEVQAAHIWGVAEGGPDLVGNGVALCGTAHWLFDRHLIGLTMDCRLIMTPGVPDGLRTLMVSDGQPLTLPHDAESRPTPPFLARRLAIFQAANA